MNVITGDETGCIKLISVTSKSIVTFSEQNRENSVNGLDWVDENRFLSIRKCGITELWEMSDSELSCLSKRSSSITEPLSVLHMKSSGTSMISYNAFGDVCVSSTDFDSNVEDKFSVDGPITYGTVSKTASSFIFGGKENDVKLYDLATKQEVWRAKNVPHDTLNLRVPIWITALSFLTSQDTTKFVSGTGYKNVRLYDTLVGRQPTVSFDIGDFRVTSIQPNRDGTAVYVGDTAGGLFLWDLRTQRRISTLKGSVGSIRDLQVNYGDGVDYLASVGLDRYMKLYSTSTNKLECSMYMKNRLNCCLVSKNTASKKGSRNLHDDSDNDEGDNADGDGDGDHDDELEEYYDSSDVNSGDDDEEDDSAGSESEESESDHEVSQKSKAKRGSSGVLPNKNKQSRRN